MQDKQKTLAKDQVNQLLNALYVKYELTPADVFKHKHYNIITRSGMEKIIEKSQIDYDLELVAHGDSYCVVKGVFTGGPEGTPKVITFASASVDTSTSAYYAEMAEKRCLSRGMLKKLGLYQQGFYGDDEFDTKSMSEAEAKAYKQSRWEASNEGKRRAEVKRG